MQLNFEGRAALVTGAAGGIGSAIGELFSQNGADVVFSDLAVHRDKILNSDVDENRIISGDITDPDDASRMFYQAQSVIGHLDTLVNCAGISGGATRTIDQKLEHWKSVLETNLQGTYLMSQAAGQIFTKQRYGCIVNLSSAVAISAVPGDNAYGVAKSGVITLTKTLATEWARFNVRVNCVAPGCIDAGMFQVSEPEWREQFLKRTPMGRFGTPDDIARAVAFLVDDSAGFITGVTLPVDGGWTAYGGSGIARDGR